MKEDKLNYVEVSFVAVFVDHAGKPDNKYPGAENVWHGLPGPVIKMLESESMMTLTDYIHGDEAYKVSIIIERIRVND